MKLVISLTSPFARKARIAMMDKKIDCETLVDIPWEATTEVPKYNPLGKIPVLILDDESTLYDSRVIVEYFDVMSPVARLIPENGRPRLVVKRWEALADGISDAAATIFLERKRAAERQDENWIARQQGKIDRGLAALSDELGDKPWCTGEAYNLADIAVGCALGYLDLRFPEIKWRKRHANLAALSEKLAQRPSFIETIPPA